MTLGVNLCQGQGPRDMESEGVVVLSDFKQLIVWQKAMDLAVQNYRLIKQLPGQERFALADQPRRAAISVPSNIAEGYARKTTNEYVQFLHIAKGSNAELQTQLLLSVRIGYFTDAQIESCMCLSGEIAKMISAIILKLSSHT